MGSGTETARAAAAALRAAGEKVGVVQAHLYRPFSVSHLLAALPASVRGIAVLDRTKEVGATGEPLFQDVVTAMAGAVASGERTTMPRVIGGRYGLSSKDFTPAMAKAAFDELKASKPRTSFTLGIDDDVNAIEPHDRRELHDREGRRHPRRLLRTWCGMGPSVPTRTASRHCRGCRSVRTGLFRL